MPYWFLALGKTVSAGFWIACAINLVRPFPEPLHFVLLYAPLFLLAIHSVEVLALWRTIKRHALVLPLDVIQVILFGVFHVAMLKQRPARNA